MPTPEERASASYAEKVINKLLPPDEAIRRQCLSVLAESISRANAYGAMKWGVTLHPDIVRLNVGHVVPFDIRRDNIFVAVIGDGLEGLTGEERATLDGLVDWRGSFDTVRPSRSFFVSPENFAAVWPLVETAYVLFIERAAQGPAELHLDCQKAHSPGVLVYLRNVLGRDVPEPSYPRLSRAMPTGGGWRERLAEWLRSNPKTMPDELRQLREEFVRRFPKERLADMTLEEYAVGTGMDDNFSYWLEYKTKKLGSVGSGNAAKTGVWWSKNENGWQWNKKLFRSPEEALSRIKNGLVRLVEATEAGRFDELDRIGEEQIGPVRYLRSKPLYFYFPEQFLPMWHPDHMANFLKLFDAEPQGEVLTRNRQLLKILRGLPEFAGFDTLQMMRFLYDSFPPQKGDAEVPDVDDPEAPPPPAVVPRELEELTQITERTRNVLIYGPPGTGKTYIVRRFAEYFLRPRLASSTDNKQRRLTMLQGLKWYEAIALAMSLAEGKRHFKVPELAANEMLQDYALLKNSAKPANTIHEQLQRHTGFDSTSVNVSGRRGPFLFDKNAQAEWTLTPGGMEYIEANLSNEVSQLRNPKRDVPRVDDYYDFVTFHQSFAYEEFVEGIKPVIDDEAGRISYEVVPGVFRRICARAEAAWRASGKDLKRAPKYLLVIDEINRANIAKVLGELITLIEDDKRLDEENEVIVRLPYSGERFGVPPNLYILGTMNTADRSIALLDLALRRRFTFVEMAPDVAAVKPAVVGGVDLRALLGRLNGRIAARLDPDHRIGHSYFIGLEDESALRFAWYHRVVPLLQEYFYNDGERLREVLGPRFVKIEGADSAARGEAGAAYYPDKVRYELQKLDGDAFLEALRQLSAGAHGRDDPAADAGVSND